MTTYNSIKPVNYLLYLIVFFASGCAEKVTKQVVINEIPPAIELTVIAAPIDTQIVNNHSLPAEVEQPATTIDPVEEKAVTIQHNTVWDRLFSLYSLPEIENERIEHEIQRYLKYPHYLTKIQQRAEPYLYFILDEIELKQIPGELALLPAVESAFRPHALSKSRASGLWQFMPATGRIFGLNQNWWYDGRNDIYKSTQAATTYLKQLATLYDNDWFLALAAYNAGKGNLRKIIRKNKKNNLATDYWSLPLRKETMTYVPRLLAIATILANADKYNIPLKHIPNKPFFNLVNIDTQLDLSIAAKLAQTPMNDFVILNPGYKRWSTSPNGPFHLLIPTAFTDSFNDKLALTPKKDRMTWIRHKIKTGENLGFIAKKHHTTVRALRQSNHLINNKIRAGKYLLIPSLSPKSKLHMATNLSQHHLYIVQKGDTFWDIARQFSVRSKDIANWNNISLNKILRPGQKLIIKKG